MKKSIVVVVLFCVLSVLVSCKCRHEWSDSTCDSPQICSKCGEQQGSALGHSFGEPFVEKESTCSETGVSVKKCSVCGKEERSELAKTSHTFSEDWTTTEEEHWHEATCVHTELTQDRGRHEWNDGEITKDSSCIEDGVKTFVCKVCGRIRTENIPATGHTVDAGVIVNEPTCTSNGLKIYSCTVCGEEMEIEIVSATGEHSYVNYRCSECGIWGKGPAGGYVFYDCDADNDSGNADGLKSSECGWRYLEAAPSDLSSSYIFGFYMIDNGRYLDNEKVGTEKAIGSGKANTEALVEAMGETAYVDYRGSEKDVYAAKACADYSITAEGVVYDDWFLPSKDELNLMYVNLKENGLGFSPDKRNRFGFYWSSSEMGSDDVWCQYFGDGDQSTSGRSYIFDDYKVRPIRAF